MAWTRRQDRGAVVAREVEHGVVAARLIAVGVGDHRLRIVGHDQLRHAADEGERARRRVKPIAHRLARRGAGVGVARRAQRGHEDVRARAVGQRDRRAGVVDEQLLAGAVDLAHRTLELLGEAPIVLAELRVAIGVALGVIGAVLLPQQHQRHAFAVQLLVQAAVVGLHMVARPFRRHQQAPFERGLVDALHARPIEAGGGGQANILGDDALRNAQRGSNLLVRQAGVEFQTQYVFNLTHIDPWYGHAVSRQKLEAYPFGCYMRNIISVPYDTVPVS